MVNRAWVAIKQGQSTHLVASRGTAFAVNFSAMFRSSQGGGPSEVEDMVPLGFGLHILTA